MQQRLRVDGDIFENAPRVDADIFYTDKKRCVFKNIRICVDEASNFAVRTSTKENRQSKFPFVVPKDPCACSDTS